MRKAEPKIIYACGAWLRVKNEEDISDADTHKDTTGGACWDAYPLRHSSCRACDEIHRIKRATISSTSSSLATPRPVMRFIGWSRQRRRCHVAVSSPMVTSPASTVSDSTFVFLDENRFCLLERDVLFLERPLGGAQSKSILSSRSMRSCDSLPFLYCCLCALTHPPSCPWPAGTLMSPYSTSSLNRVSHGTFFFAFFFFVSAHSKPMLSSRSM